MNFTSLKGGVLSNLYCAQRIWTIPRRRRAIWIRTTLRVHVAGVLSCIMFFLQMVFYKTQDCQENRGTLPRWKQATASICIRTIVFFAVCEGFSVTFCDKSYHWGGYIYLKGSTWNANPAEKQAMEEEERCLWQATNLGSGSVDLSIHGLFESSGFSPKDEKRPFGPIPKKLVIKTVLSLVFWCQKLQSFEETMWFVTDSFSWCRDLQHTENESTSLAKSFGVPRAPLAGNRRKPEIWGIERSLSTARKKCAPSCGFVWIFASWTAFYSVKSWYVRYVQLFSINVTTRYIYIIPDITSGGIGAPAGQWSLNPATGWSGSGQWLDDDLHELDDQDTSYATCCTCVCILYTVYIFAIFHTKCKRYKNMICACSTYLVKKPADCKALELNEKGLWVRKKKPTTEVRGGEVLQPPSLSVEESYWLQGQRRYIACFHV